MITVWKVWMRITKKDRTVFSGALFSFLNGGGVLIFDETEPSTFLADFDTFGILGQFATAIAFRTDNEAIFFWTVRFLHICLLTLH
jgi:hypothetical protein